MHSYILTIAAAVSCFWTTETFAAPIGGPITNPANGHHYYLLAASNWLEAEAEAVAMGGHLVTINDKPENDWVYATFAHYGGPTRNLWIGLTDAAAEGTYVWISGDTATYFNWGGSEPNNNGNEDYGSFYVGIYGNGWNDTTISASGAGAGGPYHGVVEINTVVGSDVPLSISLAVELHFDTEINSVYAIQVSQDLTTWTDDELINGTGGTIIEFRSTNSSRKFWRVKKQ